MGSLWRGALTTTWPSTPRETKELIVDFKTKDGTPALSLWVSTSLRTLLGTLNTSPAWPLLFLRRLKKFHLSPQILLNFYRCTIESILISCITVRYSTATGRSLTGKHCRGMVKNCPTHHRFSTSCHRGWAASSGTHLTPTTGRHYRTLWSRTSRLRKKLLPLSGELAELCTSVTATFILLILYISMHSYPLLFIPHSLYYRPIFYSALLLLFAHLVRCWTAFSVPVL